MTAGEPNECRGAKKPQQDMCFNTVNLLPKELRFEHGGAKLASCPGRYLTSLPPCNDNKLPEIDNANNAGVLCKV